jgi:hypothetical protein
MILQTHRLIPETDFFLPKCSTQDENQSAAAVVPPPLWCPAPRSEASKHCPTYYLTRPRC